jgi:hypothetical protein
MKTNYSRRELYALGEPLGESITRKEGGRIVYGGGGGDGGGGQPAPTQNTSYSTNIPEYAKPYVETMLGATQKQLFQTTPNAAGGTDITGFQPYKAYGGTYDANGNQISYDPSKGIAGFQPMQQQAQQGVANMRVPGQYNQAMDITGAGIGGALGTAGQGLGLSGMGYQAADAGNQYAMQATNPYAMQAYMSPYMQNVVDAQQREAQRKADIATTGRNAQAVQAGAFGGSRQALTDAEANRNLALQQSDIQATGLQSAFQNAQQAQQYGANLGLQGMQAGIQGVGAGIGAQQAAYNQAMSGAQNLANLGQQQLAAQQGIYGLQNQYGAQQQALEQQKLNQAQQDFANAQQYPLMQLGTMSNMIRGLPMQASTTQQYQAQPNYLTQGIGAAGAAASLASALKAKGGVIKGMAKGGIASYDVGGEVEHDLYSMDEEGLQRELKESSSPTVKRIAQRLLKMKQMENQPGMAGGGIIAFAEGEKVEEPSSSEILQQRVMQGKPTGDITKVPSPVIAQQPLVKPAPPAAPQIENTLGNISPYYAAEYAKAQEANKESEADIAARLRKQAGPNEGAIEQRAGLMKERANAQDEAERNRALRVAEFFARWGSTPGPTLVAGLNAVKESVPGLITDEKQAKEIRMKIDNSIGELDQATRLEERGFDKDARAIKEKNADRMQHVQDQLAKAQEDKARLDAEAARTESTNKAHLQATEYTANKMLEGHKYTADLHLQAEKLRQKSEQARMAAEAANKKDAAVFNQLNVMYAKSAAELAELARERDIKGGSYQRAQVVIERAEMGSPNAFDPATGTYNVEKMDPVFKGPYLAAQAKIAEMEKNLRERERVIKERVKPFEERALGKQTSSSSGNPPPPPTGARLD